MARAAHSSVGKQFADLCTRHRLSPQPQFRIGRHLETHLTAILCEQANVACRLVAKMEVVTFVHLASLQTFLENVMSKVMWSHERQIAGEGEQKSGVQTRGLQQAKFLGSRR